MTAHTPADMPGPDRLFPFARIVWEDHFSTPGWHDLTVPQEAEEAKRMLCFTRGYIIGDEADRLHISNTITSSGEASDILVILKSTIVEFRILSRQRLLRGATIKVPRRLKRGKTARRRRRR